MFKVQKHADMSQKAAIKAGYSTAEIAGWAEYSYEVTYADGSKETRYKWPFTTTVLGCGTTVPEDYNPKKQYKFKVPKDTSKKQALAEFEAAMDAGITPHALLSGSNGGIDLDDRAKAPPKAQGRVTEADKLHWVVVNRPKRAAKCSTVEQYVVVYDEEITKAA